MPKFTYKKSGVDIDKARVLLREIKPLIKKTFTREVLADIGSFGGLFDASIFKKYKNPVLVSSTDGVGTKLKIAFLVDKHDTVGIDLVAMNVNDILTFGAKPLFFLDYLACGKLEEEKYIEIIKGITRGCQEAGCSLIAGETAEMPGMYKEGEYDLAGFCVGVVEKDKIIDGKEIRRGDKVVGLASSGLHSNGFSLVRKVFNLNEQKRLAKILLKPTRIYVKPILSLLANHYSLLIKGIAHITGGAFYEKIPRIIPEGRAILIKKKSWPIPKIFKLIQEKGNIEEKEMYRTFNMGIGMVLVVKKDKGEAVIKELEKSKIKSWIIGEVVEGNREIMIV
ncbi:MAG: phosphoribosylformylglycinamidine cyclo-ligase [Candidatus Omnitrophica bacterium]|nr:phosphoribosylformylglycinamidine cyclo-ligase [Candidatus Omnitrophota bacterium]MCM8797859.1 phosphoribosylformylglycinamidine cyclo-ligase [Candidatus Omnitrophota bacterium]